MKPEFFQIKDGCYKIGINPVMSGLTKKPVVKIEWVEDGEYQEEIDFAIFTFRTIENFDLFIQKLQDARAFLLHER